MRIPLYAVSMVVMAAGSGLGAQIRTPIATEPLVNTAPGPAPYNAKATAVSATSIAVSWDGVGGTKGYTVDRVRTDSASCCVAHSGLITMPSWTDGSLESGREYAYTITALYSDGRVGSTQVIAATPMPALPAVRLPKDADKLASTETILRYTACSEKNAGPGPSRIDPQPGTPGGAKFTWPTMGSGMQYVVDRAPEGTTTWTLVGSTCGGPSPVYPLYNGTVYIRDLAGGITPSSRYVYRVTAVDSKGSAGWNTYHFTAPCRALPAPVATPAGSSVTLTWTSGSSCNSEPSASPDSYTITTSFGYTKTVSEYAALKDIIYGVPLGTHTFTVVGNYRPGVSTAPASVQATVAY